MSARTLSPDQPKSFAFSAENAALLEKEIAKYPEGREASAVIAALWIGQEQEGWVSRPMIEVVAKRLHMPPIRVLEVATFYTMFHLKPSGKYVVQICSCVPCSFLGANVLLDVCKKEISPTPFTVSEDGMFSWEEVECLGACTSAPVMQINGDLYEKLTPEGAAEIFAALRRGEHPAPGIQSETIEKGGQ